MYVSRLPWAWLCSEGALWSSRQQPWEARVFVVPKSQAGAGERERFWQVPDSLAERKPSVDPGSPRCPSSNEPVCFIEPLGAGSNY